MSCILLDTFRGAADEALSAHTPVIGGPWTQIGAATPKLEGNLPESSSPWLYDGRLWLPDSAAQADPNVGCPVLTGADVRITAIARFGSLAPGDGYVSGIAARWNGTTTWYALMLSSDVGNVQLFKHVAGVETALGEWSPGPMEAGLAYPLALEIVGDQLTVSYGNTTEAPITDATIAAAGRAGVIFLTNGNKALTHAVTLEDLAIYQL